jgi:hypothetical protein
MGFVVGDQFRTNSLSLKPGGYTICALRTDGKIYEYTKVKSPQAYLKKMMGDKDVLEGWIKNN